MSSHKHKQKIHVPIQGMHCRSCEVLIEEHVSRVARVDNARASFSIGGVDVYYSGQQPRESEIEKAIHSAGYEVGRDRPLAWLNRNPHDYRDLGIAFLLAVVGYLVLQYLGILELGAGLADASFSLPIVLLVGLTAGFSTCMALVGGIVLGMATRHAQAHPEASAQEKFRPHLFFNAGRIGGYVLLGGVLGAAGSIFQLSNSVTGLLTLAVGFVMLLVGLQLVDVFPRLTRWKFTLPKQLSRALGIKNHVKEYSHRQAALTGALTFFLPCGFTQAMQLYAVSSGDPLSGALIMGVFALGTAPGLLSVGGITSVVRGAFAKRFFKFAGLVVIALALFNLSNASRLLGLGAGGMLNSPARAADAVTAVADPNVVMKNGVQVVTMIENNRGYSPNKFTITKGIPVRWVIDAQAPYSCASAMVLPSLNRRFNLQPGENIIEFTPDKVGTMKFSCSMGMYTGAFTVVEPGTQAKTAPDGQPTDTESVSAAGACGSGGGCGGCGGGKPFVPNSGTNSAPSVPASTSGAPSGQVLRTVYTYEDDILPNVFNVTAGKPVTLEIDVRENGYGCMSTIMIPGLYDQAEYLQKGKKIVMNFTPQTKGEYFITCAMGVPRGIINVQ